VEGCISTWFCEFPRCTISSFRNFQHSSSRRERYRKRNRPGTAFDWFGMVWHRFAESGSGSGAPYEVGGPDMAFAYVANPSSSTIGASQDFSSAYPQWVGTIISNAIKGLQHAFARFPIRVELASAHTSVSSTKRDQEHIVGVVGGWPDQGATGQLVAPLIVQCTTGRYS